MSLQNLVWFAKHRRETYERLLYKKTGTRSAWEYPFAAAGVNVTFALVDVLELRGGTRVRRRGGSGGRAFGNDARAAHERRGGVFGPARPRDSLDRARCAFGRRARRAFARLERLECRSRFRRLNICTRRSGKCSITSGWTKRRRTWSSRVSWTARRTECVWRWKGRGKRRGGARWRACETRSGSTASSARNKTFLFPGRRITRRFVPNFYFKLQVRRPLRSSETARKSRFEIQPF